jgi:RsiW-degrading membrane proteinase PrsW (M82 family)
VSIRLEAVLAAYVPALLWLIFVYSRDRYEKESKLTVAGLFLGAIVGTLIAATLEQALHARLRGVPVGTVIVSAVAIGVIEEGSKFAVTYVGTRRSKSLNEPVDGMIYASSTALGFAAFETTGYILFYYHRFLTEGASNGYAAHLALTQIAPLRAFTGAVGHMAWAGLIGYAWGMYRTARGSKAKIWGAYLVAAALHAGFDGLLSEGAGTLALILLVVSVVVYVRLFHRALSASPFRTHELRAVPISPPLHPSNPLAQAALPPRPDAWTATHTIPSSGLPAWSRPNPSSALMGTIPGGAQVREVERLGAWAHVLTRDGWTGWVDGRLLVPKRPEG